MLYSTHFDVHVQQDPSEDNAGRVARIRLWLQTSSRLDPQRYSRVRDLADALLDGFLDSGGLDDINEVVMHATNATSLCPSSDSNETAMCLDLLGICLRYRFHFFLETMLILKFEAAVSAQKEAVALTPDGHKYSVIYLADLGVILSSFRTVGRSS